MTQIQKCPTCGRRPSERTDIVLAGETTRKCVVTPWCTNPLHDAADLGPAAAALLREAECRVPHYPSADCLSKRIRALLASLPVKT